MPCPVCRSGWECIGVLLIDPQFFAFDHNHLVKPGNAVIFAQVKMKKIIASIAFLCYFAASCGIIMDFHYCMNKLASVHFFQSSVDVCARCGMDTHQSNGCCRDEIKFAKLEQDQNKIPVLVYDMPAIEKLVIIPSEFIAASFINESTERHFHNHSPPLLSGQDIYLQNNVFRI